jgi:hypothetical protein
MSKDEILLILREAFDSDRVEATRHFWDELRADAFGLADVMSAVDSIYKIVEMGLDDAGHNKLEATGRAVDGRALSIILAIKAETNAVLMITAYEGD